MRLKKIRLSGFKSFVDPTTVAFPGDLTGIVGPNGCGKSNIIDAVRWVMGESSAKHLRGDSMADVIFNGSSSRKPVGVASIELLFDNSEGSLGGQYANYAEIAVRRQVNRDGQSAYYLNGTRCRKRDITDVFLGTGLGPRSYSIIEQGMISRVIEARPEELRGYLEEAAGISLYKERRRETERRIRDTNENLERLQDVRDEVERQLEKLSRQAETAEQYQRLRADERTCRAELHWLRRRRLEQEQEQLEREIRDMETRRESMVAEQRGLERDYAAVRALHVEESDGLNEIQGRYYALGSDLARVEQRIAHRRELRESGTRELDRNEAALAELDAGLADDEEKRAVLQRRLDELAPELEQAREREDVAASDVDEATAAVESWREQWEAFSAAAAEPVRTAQVERTRIEQMERRSEELARRQDRLAAEAERLESGRAELDPAGPREELEELGERLAEARESLSDRNSRLARLDEEQAELDEELAALGNRRQQAEARRVGLRTLQEHALGRDGARQEWLRRVELDGCPVVAEALSVEPGWETAVETVLGERLQARLAPAAALAGALAAPLPESIRVGLFEEGDGKPPTGLEGSLAERVQGPASVVAMLASVHAIDADARADVRPAHGESAVTRGGAWFGPGWVLLGVAGEGEEGGVLTRERELAELDATIDADSRRIESLDEQAARAREERQAEAGRRDAVADEVFDLEREQATLESRIETRQQRLESAETRLAAVAAEREELAEDLHEAEAETREATARLEAALDAGERHDAERERFTAEKLSLQQRVDDARGVLREVRDARHALALKRENAATALDALESSAARTRAQRERVTEQVTVLRERLAGLDSPDDNLDAEREDLLARRAAVESELGEARARLGEADNRMRELERARAEVAQRIEAVRGDLESRRLAASEVRIHADAEREALDELDVVLADIVAALPAEAEESDRAARLDQLSNRIARLGPINLAAIDEHAQLAERRDYLESQHRDLSEAMETLQTAIRRIDRETRQRFRDTFEKVNAGLQALFPRLFGGGQAYLEMTDDDLLETGVTIMARPPGKKITNIHLLSGGEKALTAVSLVFAIFALNPAPFCMLDEVDAPLDEANVGRFCEMLRDMCTRVQFIVITHNKTTMEAVTHLAGVTMNEPGVSRLVAVDVDEAAELAALT